MKAPVKNAQQKKINTSNITVEPETITIILDYAEDNPNEELVSLTLPLLNNNYNLYKDANDKPYKIYQLHNGGSLKIRVLKNDNGTISNIAKSSMIDNLPNLSKARTGGANQKGVKYHKTTRKHTDKSGKTRTIYTKDGKEYVQRRSKKTGKVRYEKV